jgi:phospholipase C
MHLPLTRRKLLQRSGAALAAAPLAGRFSSPALASTLRQVGSLPDPTRPAGTSTAALPFDHIVVVMMENHSFDNLLGALPIQGQPAADGLTFNGSGVAQNTNPGPSGPVQSFKFASTAQGPNVSQSWDATHEQIDNGKMDGFVTSNGNTTQTMGYWDDTVLPFPYSLARTFTVGNRWFCSAPCQTFPNRRFLMAGTAYGNVSTDLASISDPPPPNGTIFDRLHQYGITWRNYYTDLPQTLIIPSVVQKYSTNIQGINQFFLDCATGNLPAVSFVDPEVGVLPEIGDFLGSVKALAPLASLLDSIGGSEEEPQNLGFGEAWAHNVVEAVLHSPAWPRTLLIYTYDEHGGYYDHVPPPAAIPPDNIPPTLAATDYPGGYDIYGVRVPAVVASPYSRPNAVSNVVHDHTSVLATIEAKWNLPALTLRDANAAPVFDFLNFAAKPAFLTPPTLAAPLP